MTIFNLDDSQVKDDTILLFGVRYAGSTSGRVYTYAGMKVAGRWYFTGKGPQDAGWAAVQRWLGADNRQVVYVKAVTGMIELWPYQGVNRPGSPYPERESQEGNLDVYQARANHPSRTGSPAASAANLDISDRWYPR